MEGRLFSQAMATFTNDLLLFECVYVCVCVCVCASLWKRLRIIIVI